VSLSAEHGGLIPAESADNPSFFAKLPPEQKVRAVKLIEERRKRRAQALFHKIYGEQDTVWDGPSIMGGLVEPGQVLHRRELYPKHMEFFKATNWRESCFMAANRVGKTFGGGGFALACFLTGIYPKWWPGHRFRGPISAWAAGDTYETTRDIIQLTLLGEISYNGGRKVMDGRGIIPGSRLGRNTWRSGVQDLVDTIAVKHVSGQWSFLGLKSYDQGRKVFQGTGRHVIWFDEEPPADVYGEALIRTATVGGLVMLTFTPLSGMSDVVLSFMAPEDKPATFD